MAGAGYNLFTTGSVLTAAQVNTFLQEQTVMRFANATARTTALSGVLAEGMMSYLDDTNSVEVYNGSAWVSVGNTGDITGVTAGTGISGGGTSGDVTITNSMATAIDAKGDLVVGTGADAFSRLAVGADNTVLTADSSTATGLKWAAAAGGKILQVVYASYGTQVTVASTTYTDTGLSATITPSSASNKILIMAAQNGYSTRNNTDMGFGLRLLRDSTQIFAPALSNYGSAYISVGGATQAGILALVPVDYLDSPNTTSAITYKIQGRAQTTANSGTVYFQESNNSTSTIILMEVAP